MGVVAACQVVPPSIDLKTRAAPPPVAIQTLLWPWTVIQVPLAANAASPGSAGGMCSAGISFQVDPPSVVLMIRQRPSTGSLRAMPFLASQNASASKNAFGFWLLNCGFQFCPPSVVL